MNVWLYEIAGLFKRKSAVWKMKGAGLCLLVILGVTLLLETLADNAGQQLQQLIDDQLRDESVHSKFLIPFSIHTQTGTFFILNLHRDTVSFLFEITDTIPSTSRRGERKVRPRSTFSEFLWFEGCK